MKRPVLAGLLLALLVAAWPSGPPLLAATAAPPEESGAAAEEAQSSDTEGAAGESEVTAEPPKKRMRPRADAELWYLGDEYKKWATGRTDKWFTEEETTPDGEPHFEVVRPLVLKHEEVSGTPDWQDWNRIAAAALAVPGRGVQTFWLVQGLDGAVCYPIVIANADDQVDTWQTPANRPLKREAVRRLWGKFERRHKPWRPLWNLGRLDWDAERWVWAVGISTATLGEQDVTGADEDRVYVLAGAYMINPYLSVVIGLTSDVKPTLGFSVDLGILGLGK